MHRQRLLAIRQVLAKHRGLLVLAVLVVYFGGGYPVSRYGATSLEITVWTHVTMGLPGQALGSPDVQIFDKTVTVLGFVHKAQLQFNTTQWGAQGGCALILSRAM